MFIYLKESEKKGAIKKMKLMYEDFNLLDLGHIIAIETLCVLTDIKPVSRFIISENNLEYVKKVCEKLDLKFNVSPFRFTFKKGDKGDIGVSRIGKNNIFQDKGDFFGYVSKSEELIDKAITVDRVEITRVDPKTLGRLFGYPECCIKFYIDNSDEAVSKRNDDYTVISLRNSKGFRFPFYLNNGKRFFDKALITFFPCSYNCKKAEIMSKKIFKELERISPEYADYIKRSLQSIILFTDNQGVHEIKGKITDNIIVHTRVVSTIKNELHKMLEKGDSIKIIDNATIQILSGNKILKVLNKNCGVMVFG